MKIPRETQWTGGPQIPGWSFTATALLAITFIVPAAELRPDPTLQRQRRRLESGQWREELEHQKRAFPIGAIPFGARTRALIETQQADVRSPRNGDTIFAR